MASAVPEGARGTPSTACPIQACMSRMLKLPCIRSSLKGRDWSTSSTLAGTWRLRGGRKGAVEAQAGTGPKCVKADIMLHSPALALTRGA